MNKTRDCGLPEDICYVPNCHLNFMNVYKRAFFNPLNTKMKLDCI
jgi:hypothetical protein